MPGHSPTEAVHAFVEPLKNALSAVARANIVLSPGAWSPQLDRQYAWTINDGRGADLGDSSTLRAEMSFRVIKDEANGPYRVTTDAYAYSLVSGEGAELFALHWHPGTGNEKPHTHLGNWAADQGVIGYRHHLPGGRVTFEQAIRWAMEFGAPPMHDDFDARLALAESAHLLHRTWNVDPALRAAHPGSQA